MNSPPDERPLLDPTESEFVERVAEHFTPGPMNAAQRVAFDEALSARLQRSPRRWLLVPALGVAAALAWFVMTLPFGPDRLEGEEGPGAALARSWETELFLSSDLSASEDLDDGDALPSEYQAIASAFFDG
jgi:hypothetical protein